jgi:hypothetical protein
MKDNNLGLPPTPLSLEELAEEQEPPMMGANRFIVPASTLINKNPSTDEVPASPMQVGAGTKLTVPNLPVLTADEVLAASMQAGASTELLVLTADEVPTPVQAGVGTEFILEEATGASYQLPVSTANEVFAASVQAGASTELPVLTANEVPTPVQADVGTGFILEEAAGSSFKISGFNYR